jgi:BclB C-terminal domain-containing protein
MVIPIDQVTPAYTASGIAFGSHVDGLIYNGISIDITNPTITTSPYDQPGMAFSMPQDGIINDLSAFFSPSTNFTISQDTTIIAELFESTVPADNIFTSTGASVSLPIYVAGAVLTGDFRNGIVSNLNFFVAAQTRLLLVFHASGGAGDIITGYGSGGVSITLTGP